MSRPLGYDEQFTSLLRSNNTFQFLYCIPLKVQSTAFYHLTTLETAMRLCSLYDLVIFFLILYSQYSSYSLIELALMLFCIFFSIFSFMLSNNLKKTYAIYYYQWRVTFLFLIPFLEFFEYNDYSRCYFTYQCSSILFYCFLSVGFTLINGYLAKITWSFLIRLELGQQLVIIHGKYLEQMLIEERNKIALINKYIPPSLNNLSNDHRLI